MFHSNAKEVDNIISGSTKRNLSGSEIIMLNYFYNERPHGTILRSRPDLPRKPLGDFRTLSNFWSGPIIFFWSLDKIHKSSVWPHSFNYMLLKLIQSFRTGL